MEKMEIFRGANAKFLPNKVVTDRLSLLEGNDRIEIYYFGRGHTDGDLVVVFPEKRLAHFGDLFPAKAAPLIDADAGGSGVAFPETLTKAIAELKNVVRVTTGHDEASAVMGAAAGASAINANPRTMSIKDLQEYADFNRDFLEAVRQAIAAGKSADEAAKTLQMPERYKAYDMANAGRTCGRSTKSLGNEDAERSRGRAEARRRRALSAEAVSSASAPLRLCALRSASFAPSASSYQFS